MLVLIATKPLDGSAREVAFNLDSARIPSPNGLGRYPTDVLLDLSTPPCTIVSRLMAMGGYSRSPEVGSVAVKKEYSGLQSGRSFAQKAAVCPNGHGDSGGPDRFFWKIEEQ